MRNSNLLATIRKMNSKEFRQFCKFIHSPYHNTDQKVIRLLQLIESEYPKLNHPKLSYEAVHQFFFPNQSILNIKDPHGKVRGIMDRLAKRLKSFYIAETLRKNERIRQELLLEHSIQNNEIKNYQKTVRQIEKTLQFSQTTELHRHLQLHQLQLNLFTHPEMIDDTRFVSMLNYINAAQKHLANYQEWFRLWYQLEHYNSSNIHTVQFGDDKEWLQTIRTKKYDSKHPTILFYVKLLRFLKWNDEGLKFNQIWTAFKDIASSLSYLDRVILFTKLLNHCKKQYRTDPAFGQTVFDLYRYSIQHKIYLKKGKIQFPFFISTVTSACICKEITWAKHFIAEYKEKITPNHIQTDVLHLAKAYINFYQGAFEIAKDHLFAAINMPNLAFNLLTRGLLIRTQYEIWQLSDKTQFAVTKKMLTDSCRNLQRFIRTKTKSGHISDKISTPYILLVEMVKELIVLKTYHGQLNSKPQHFTKKILELEEKLATKPVFADKWFKEKIQQIVKGVP